jgi:hypothetical protein
LVPEREASGRLEKAFELRDAKEIKLAAPEDPDLQPLWKDERQT